MLRGTIAAALTPLRDGGTAVDAEAIAPYTDFLAAGGVDGILACGSTDSNGVSRTFSPAMFGAASRSRSITGTGIAYPLRPANS